MDKETLEHKKFLEKQIEWCKEQDHIIEEIEKKLYEMREMAEYALANDVTSDEVGRLNSQLDNLKKEIQYLEKQLHSVVH